MLAVGFLVFRLICDSQQGKADARANGLATAAASIYESESRAARGDAQTIARARRRRASSQLTASVAALDHAGRARPLDREPRHAHLIDSRRPDGGRPRDGARRRSGGSPMTITASELTASQYARQLPGPASR